MNDQSIYGWRGAKVENIASFEASFDKAKVIRLEQNYRSTSVILSAANALIDNNQNRLGKNLWTWLIRGRTHYFIPSLHEQDEARFIAGTI